MHFNLPFVPFLSKCKKMCITLVKSPIVDRKHFKSEQQANFFISSPKPSVL